MKRIFGIAALVAALLTWGPSLVSADGVSNQTSASADVSKALAAPVDVAADPNVTQAVSETVINATASTRASTNASTDSDEAPPSQRPQRAGLIEAPGLLLPTSEAETGTVIAAGAGTLVGLGFLLYYWGTLKVWLLGSLFAPFFSRIAKDKVLDNEVRSQVFDAIVENPGVTIKEITTLCSIGWGTAVYHLKRLEDERLVISERHRQFRRYFKNGGGIVNKEKAAFSEMKNETSQALARALLASPGSVQKDLCEQVGISAPLAHKYLNRMAEAKLVTRERDWKFVRYYPTEALGALIEAPLVVAA
jgi:DNA-binding MarR family transcriptional regulator